MKPIFYLLVMLQVIFSNETNATAILYCPPDQTLPCTSQSSNLMYYGDAYIMKDGVKYDAGLANVTKNLNSCNVGTITRKWQVEDINGTILQCTQKLTFSAGNFNQSNITWPDTDLQLPGCEADLDPNNLPEEYQEPYYYHGLCNNIGQSYKDQVFNFGPDCKKIVRTWTILDWCTFVPGTGQGIWTYSQVFKLSNDSDPALNCPSKRTIVAKQCNASYVTLPLVTAEGNSCTEGYLITNTSVYADTTSNDASGTYPVGDHIISYEVEYACGQKNFCQTAVSIIEPNPVPYCLATLNVVLMGVDSDNNGSVDEGMVDVWAKDVNVNSYHPCHSVPLNFSFEPDSLVMSKTFTCEEAGRNNLNVYVTDHQGKQAYCRVDIIVQNNGANIPDCYPTEGSRPLVAGLVTHPSGEAISGTIIAHKDVNPMQESTVTGVNTWHNVNYQKTDSNGQFSSSEIAMYRSYQVEAYKEGDVTRMNEADVAILEAYIKGEYKFKNAYSYLAADLNEDGIVNIDDFHLMKNLLHASEAQWPNQMQWTFYTCLSLELQQRDEDGMISSARLAKNINIESLDWGWGDNLDFIGILKGDLDFYEAMDLEE